MINYPQFPPDFYFGSATAAYQIEGGWNADGKGLSTWDFFSHKPGKIKTGETGDVACNTYYDFQIDIDIRIRDPITAVLSLCQARNQAYQHRRLPGFVASEDGRSCWQQLTGIRF